MHHHEKPFPAGTRQSCGRPNWANCNNACLTHDCAAFLQMRHIISQYLSLCTATSASITLLDGSTISGRLNSLYPADCGGLLLLANTDNTIQSAVPICQIAAFTPSCNACIDYLAAPSSCNQCCNYACESALAEFLRIGCQDVILLRHGTALASGKISAVNWGVITISSSTGESPRQSYIATSAVSSVTMDN